MIEMRLDEIAAAMDGRPSAPAKGLRVKGVSTDSRTAKPGDLFFAIRGERFDGHEYVSQAIARGAVACVVSRPVPAASVPCLTVDDTVAALGRLAAHHRTRAGATVVAVTGSNGKTTTKSMIDHVLSTRLGGRAAIKSFNNQVGVPLTLLSVQADDEYLVVEIGSSAPGEVENLTRMASPEIGVITSVGPAHLEGLGGIEGVVREKVSLLRHVRAAGTAVVNADQPELLAAADDVLRRTERSVELVTFGRSEAAGLRITRVSTDLRRTRFCLGAGPRIDLPLCGTHNTANAAATFAVCRRLGLTADQIAAALATFQPADMRLKVTCCGEVTVINDSYNANPASMAAAIEVLAGAGGTRRVLVTGDMLELGDQAGSWHEQVGRQAAGSGIELLIAAGAQARFTAAGARAVNPTLETVVCQDADRAARAVAERLRPGDVVLVKGSRGMAMERVVGAIAPE